MSTIFGHGRLRLYLLKLLDESPKHGYEIISLLRDRFLGVYSPSPGTIYPRLARLEEEGLVTHEEVNGRKVYRLTDRGREELRNRSTDLNDLEQELSESVRDVARAVKEDVRDTIGSLREELKYAASGGRRAKGPASGAPSAEEGAGEEGSDEGEEREGAGPWWGRDWERFAKGVGGTWKGAWEGAWGSWGSWGGRTTEGAEGTEGSEGAEGASSERERSGGRPEFEQTLHDFADRVRDVVSGAGAVGETAARDLKRILDDTLDVIQRDMADWGPGGRERPCGDRSAGKPAEEPADESSEGPAAGTTTVEDTTAGAEDTTASGGEEKHPSAEEAKPPFAQPPAAEDASDPWSTAVHEEPRRDRPEPDTDAPEGSDGSASAESGQNGATDTGQKDDRPD